MRKILQLALICTGIGIVAASGTSCSSVYDATPAVPGRDTIKNPLRGTFTATLDGVEFVANSKYVSDQTINGTRTLTVTGVMDSPNKDPETNKTLSFTITNYEGPKTYEIQSNVVGLYVYQEKGVSTSFLARNGDPAWTVTITKDQGDVEGTFNWVVAPGGVGTADNHNVSNGSFSISK
ncbi:MAG: hypothetical protein EOP49_29810 [Sphingobacteriales bacterium]|nr:MAG: hypothetical protein EOP49_29810 [Sphingobacteriales bacterium]